MLRQIITPSEPAFTINLPNNMIGKTVEVIVFEIEAATPENAKAAQEEKAQKLIAIRAITRKSLVDTCLQQS